MSEESLPALAGRACPKAQPFALRMAVVAGTLLLLAAGLYVAPKPVSMGMLTASIGALLIWLMASRPELGLLALVFLTSSFVRVDAIDLRLSYGGLDLRDITLFGLLGMLILRGLARRNLRLPWPQVAIPIMAFIGASIFSALYALRIQDVSPENVFGELRPLLYYMAFLITAWTIVRRDQLVVLLVGLMLLADMTGVVILLQQLLGTGNRLLTAMTGGAWQVWQAREAPAAFGTVRVVPPGHVLMTVMMVAAFCLAIYGRQKPWPRLFYVAQVLFLNLALLFTYTRAQWVAAAVALLVVSIALPLREKGQAVKMLLLLAVTGFAAYSFFKAEIQELKETPVVEALTLRAGSIFTPSQTMETYSLKWRAFETREAINSISQHPLLGVGLGNAYRDITLLQGEASSLYYRFTRYVHNSYLFIGVKMGLSGLFLFLFFALVFLFRAWQVWRTTVDVEMRLVVLAMVASFLGILFWSGSQTHLIQTESAVVIGVIAGIVGSIRGMSRMAAPDRVQMRAEA